MCVYAACICQWLHTLVLAPVAPAVQDASLEVPAPTVGSTAGAMDLLQQIQGGARLRSAPKIPEAHDEDPENDLLAAIRGGMKLKKADARPIQPPVRRPDPGNSIASAMEQYRKLVADSDSDSDSDSRSSSDSDWD